MINIPALGKLFSSTEETLWVAFAAIIAVNLYLWMRRPVGYPAGPLRIPLVGSLWRLDIRKSLAKQFMELAKTYGKVFSIKLGEYDAVVVKDLKFMKELLAKEEAAGRWMVFQWEYLYFKQNVGIAFCEGEQWKTNRRFILKSLKDFGYGKASAMEALIKDEIHELLASIVPYDDQQNNPRGKPFVTELGDHFVAMVVNSLWMIIADRRVRGDDEEFKKVFHSFRFSFNSTAFFSLMPSLIPFLPKWAYGLPKLDEDRATMFGYMERIVADHKASLDPESPRDMIDKYLLEQKAEEEASQGKRQFTDLNLTAILVDLFAAGTETTSTTLKWFFLLMVVYPDIQKRIQEEIDEVIGHGRSPSWDDSTAMHLTQAAIHEVLRFVTIVPLGVDHRLVNDVKLDGHSLPKGTIIISNLYAVHMDPEYWDEPEKFNPDRFLDSRGHFVKHPAFVPFQTGKRQCPGESLARMTIFLVVTHLLQLFTFEKIAGSEYRLDARPNSQLVNNPYQHGMRVVPRMLASGDHAPAD